MKSKILVLLIVGVFSISTGIRGATPDLKESLKVEKPKDFSKKVAISPISGTEFTISNIIQKDISAIVLVENQNSASFQPETALLQNAQCKTSKSEKGNDNYSHRKPRDGISSNK